MGEVAPATVSTTAPAQGAPWANSKSMLWFWSQKLQEVRDIPVELASAAATMPPTLFSSEVHRRAHEIALAELDPTMAQDVIRRCAVEIEVRQDKILQQPLPRELALVGAELDGDVLVLGAVDLRRLEGFAIVDRLGEARLEFGKACFRVGHVRHLGSGNGATTPGGVSARLLHLACIRIHVGKEPHVEKKVGVELLRLDMCYRFVDTLGLGSQKLHEDRHRHFGTWKRSWNEVLSLG
jgi:hypothetical protein